MAGDAHYANVVLLLHGDGTNGSTTIADNSPTPKTVTCSGSASISTAQSKFGGASIGMTLGGSGSVSVSHASDFNFGSGNFTIRFWYRPVAQMAYSAVIAGDEPDQPLCLYHGTAVNGGNPVMAIGPNGSSWFSAASSMSFGAVTNGVWYFLEFEREGNVFRCFKDGVQQSSGTTDSAGQAVGNIASFTLGKNAAHYVSCYIDDLQITKGVARRTGSGSYAVPTGPFPNGDYSVDGVILDDTGSPCARTVRLIDRATGALIGSVTSDAGTGAYSIGTDTLDEVQRIVLDDLSGTLYNDLIDRVIPA